MESITLTTPPGRLQAS
jgi:hypothetical protein